MKSTIYFGNVDRTQSIADWKANQADGAPPGTYVSNMSDEDAARWRGSVVGWRTKVWVVTVRRTIHYSQVVARFEHFADGKSHVTLSTNGRICLDSDGTVELAEILRQGFAILGRLANGDDAAVKSEIAETGHPEVPTM